MSSRVKLSGKRHVLHIDSSSYPKSLKMIDNPPSKLYVIGNVDILCEGLAIVGARKATPYGLSCSKHFSKIAAQSGIVIVSGGALGCDIEAHRSALDVNGKTIVVFGGGCDKPYPAKNVTIFQKIIDSGGAIISENPWEYDPKPYTFRNRNRIIAGLSKAIVIAEAGIPSGTFSTADFAIKYNKEVLAIPGPISFSGSQGCNKLIFDGAIPLINDDVFYDFLFNTFCALKPCELIDKLESNKINKNNFKKSRNILVEALSAQPMTLEDLYLLALKECGSQNPNVWLSTNLIKAESSGKVAKYANGMYGPVYR